ncbi:MAG: methyltransferase domain-containing protein [bacterium]|nr:methyltransferase domain-containing protein [bacterium]
MHLTLREGMRVADFGTGTGHYARSAAAIVGREGRVYAIDVQEDVLKHAELNMGRHGHGVVEYVWGNIEKRAGTKLRDASIDAVILANALFQVEDRSGLLEEIRRVLKPSSGKVLIVDWAGSYGGMGPASVQVVTEHAAEELFISAGFHKQEGFRAGPHHYGLIFTSP